MCENLEQALNPHYLWLPISNGYWVHKSKIGLTCAAPCGKAVPEEVKSQVHAYIHESQITNPVPWLLPLLSACLQISRELVTSNLLSFPFSELQISGDRVTSKPLSFPFSELVLADLSWTCHIEPPFIPVFRVRLQISGDRVTSNRISFLFLELLATDISGWGTCLI